MAKMTWKQARAKSGLAKFERTNRRKTKFGGRMMLAYNVPGTPENGKREMYSRDAMDLYKSQSEKNNPPQKPKKGRAAKRPVKRAKKRPVKRAKKPAQKNPAKSKRITTSTGWIPGSAFRVVMKRGQAPQVLVKR